MNDDDAEVMEALTRGRLIFPFLEEMEGLRAAGPLTVPEKARLGDLESAYSYMQTCDKKFNAAYERGDLEEALEAASKALGEMENLAEETMGGS